MLTHVKDWVDVLHTDVHLEMFLKNNGTMSDTDKETYRQLWRMEKGLEDFSIEECEELCDDCDCEKSDMNNMTKKELEEFVKKVHNIDLDRRQTKENMLKELNESLEYYNEKE